jgi:hypothetical protein
VTQISKEIIRYRKMANDGWIDSMYLLASALLNFDTSNERGVEACKWLFMASFFDHKKSKDALDFVASTLGKEAFNKGCDEATAWLEQKYKDFQTDVDIGNWSSELYELVKDGVDSTKRKAALKLVWTSSKVVD